MGKGLPKYLYPPSLVLGAMLLVAGAASVISPDARPQGYARLLSRQAVAFSGAPGPVTDCLMREAQLRQHGVIPDERFEGLRTFCRQAARADAARQRRPDALARLGEPAPRDRAQ